MVSGWPCKGPPCPLLHLACCPIALPKPSLYPYSPEEHRLLRPQDPLARDTAESFLTPYPHGALSPSCCGTASDGVWAVWAVVGSLYNPKPELLSQ